MADLELWIAIIALSAVLLAQAVAAVILLFAIRKKQAGRQTPDEPLEKIESVELQDIVYTYNPGTPQAVRALDHVSVSFAPGHIVGIIGHTGSGKSTLVQMLNGLLRPESGRVLLNGKDIWEKPHRIVQVRFRVGLVMQYPDYQRFEETVEKDVSFGPRNMKLPEEEIKERAERALRFVGLDRDVMEKSPFDLSGGQKRRAAIAGVMAMQPDVLVLDEPAAGLDPRGRDIIFEGIRQYRASTGATVLIISHSMEDMASICDDLVVMDHARVLVSGPTNEIFLQPELLAGAGLDIPKVTQLLEMLRQKGVPVSSGIFTVDRAVAELSRLLGRGEGAS
ncbi:MAG: energy-coupling factor transporter ATPase [Clostridia bacterium]|nr:energy-coupling factor transporter ATPase [Clostridia bacterium]